MSRILKMCEGMLRHHKKYSAASALLAAFGIALQFYGYIVPALFLYLLLSVLLLNFLTVLKMQDSVSVFAARSKIRNLDYIIIGDLCANSISIPAKKTAVRFAAPDRSFYASYEILRHAFGILKEPGGTAILAVREKKLESYAYTVFDMPVICLSPTSVRRLHLEKQKLQASYPFLVTPMRSLKLLTGFGMAAQAENLTEISCPDKEVEDFCKERGIRLIVLIEPMKGAVRSE